MASSSVNCSRATASHSALISEALKVLGKVETKYCCRRRWFSGRCKSRTFTFSDFSLKNPKLISQTRAQIHSVHFTLRMNKTISNDKLQGLWFLHKGQSNLSTFDCSPRAEAVKFLELPFGFLDFRRFCIPKTSQVCAKKTFALLSDLVQIQIWKVSSRTPKQTSWRMNLSNQIVDQNWGKKEWIGMSFLTYHMEALIYARMDFWHCSSIAGNLRNTTKFTIAAMSVSIQRICKFLQFEGKFCWFQESFW